MQLMIISVNSGSVSILSRNSRVIEPCPLKKVESVKLNLRVFRKSKVANMTALSLNTVL